MSRTPYFLRKYFHKNIYKTFLVSWGVIYLWYELPHLSYHRYTNWCKLYGESCKLCFKTYNYNYNG